MQLSSFCVSRYGACASVLARYITATSFISPIHLDRSLLTLEPCISLSLSLSLSLSRTNLFASLIFLIKRSSLHQLLSLTWFLFEFCVFLQCCFSALWLVYIGRLFSTYLLGPLTNFNLIWNPFICIYGWMHRYYINLYIFVIGHRSSKKAGYPLPMNAWHWSRCAARTLTYVPSSLSWIDRIYLSIKRDQANISLVLFVCVLELSLCL